MVPNILHHLRRGESNVFTCKPPVVESRPRLKFRSASKLIATGEMAAMQQSRFLLALDFARIELDDGDFQGDQCFIYGVRFSCLTSYHKRNAPVIHV